MEGNDSAIEILDSPQVTDSKRKRDHEDSSENDYNVGAAPKHPLLDSITNRFEQNRAEREEKNAMLKSKREIEKVHANYLKQAVDPQELARASYAVNYWAKKNGIKDTVPSLSTMPCQSGSPQANEAKKKHSKQKKKKQTDWSTVTSVSEIDLPENVSIVSLRSKEGENTQILYSAASEGKFVCPVLFCDAKFSSEGSFGHHMNLFKHSPCNALRLIEDTKLLPDPLCYKCPDCDLEFESKDLCREHMDKKNHLVFYPPLAITAYLCPECLYLFKNFQSCLSNMENSRHYNFKFPFKDDETASDFNLPVAVAENFVQDYIKECEKIPFQVQCMECSMVILSPADFKQHPNFHRVCVLTDNDLASLFSTYIKTFSCDRCHQLFKDQPDRDSRHICVDGSVGIIKANLVNTTSEFVRYCAISLIQSLRGKMAQKTLKNIGKGKQSKKHNPLATVDIKNERNGEGDFYLNDTSLQGEISNRFQSSGENDKSEQSKCDSKQNPPSTSKEKTGYDTPTSSKHLVKEKIKSLENTTGKSPTKRLSCSLHELHIDSESENAICIKKEPQETRNELEPLILNDMKLDLTKKVKQEVEATVSTLTEEVACTKEPICQNRVKQEVQETTGNVSYNGDCATEPVGQNGVKQEFQGTRPNVNVGGESSREPVGLIGISQEFQGPRPNVTVKGESSTNLRCQLRVKQEVQETKPSVIVKRETTTESVNQYRRKTELEGELPYNIKQELPSTSNGMVSETQTFEPSSTSDKSDSDVELIEISESDDSTDRIIISDTDDSVNDEVGKESKPQKEGMVISPSKRKRKRKKKRSKKLTKRQKRLAEEAAKVISSERFLKFLDKEEKKKDEDPEVKQMPGRQAKANANKVLEKRKNRALAMIEQKKLKRAQRIEVARQNNPCKAAVSNVKKESTVKEATLTDEKILKKEQTLEQPWNVALEGADNGPSIWLQAQDHELALVSQDANLISTENLKKMRNIIFLDLDNFPTFFRVLPHSPPEDMFVWAFYGGGFNVGRKTLNEIYFEMRQNGQVYISDRCGQTKDAADFALVLTVGKMDERLPSNVSFTIVSADKGFCEVERQMQQSSRSARVINPKQDTDILLPILRSLVEM